MDKVKPTLKGKFEGREMTLFEVKDFFFTYKNNFNSLTFNNVKEFRELVNGFWQAEGYIGGIFRSELNFYPLCTATQLLSKQSIEFFLRLDKDLSNKGSFSITLNSMSKFVLVYRLSGWDTFFSTFVPYFNMLYGAKYKAIFKLKRIYELKNLIKKNSSLAHNKVLLVRTVYSLTAHSPRYKLSIEEKLISLNLNPELLKELPEYSYPENNISLSFLFILGFFIGDGTLHLKLEWKDKNSTIAIIPLFNIIQSNVESNKQVMGKMTEVLNNLGLKASLSKDNKVFTLTVKGIKNVFYSLLPLLKEHSHFLYWKIDSLNLLVWVKQLVKSGGHHTYFGLKALIIKLYSSVNERLTSEEVWMDRLEIWLKTASSRRAWGEQYITPIYTPNKVIRGWQVRFPITLKLPKSNKAFMVSTSGGQEKAFALAVQYRDKIIFDWIKTF